LNSNINLKECAFCCFTLHKALFIKNYGAGKGKISLWDQEVGTSTEECSEHCCTLRMNTTVFKCVGMCSAE
jgi:hypothetical protein